MRYLSFLLALTLAACGGGGGESAPAASVAAQPRAVLVEAYGDSTMYGTTLVAGAVSRVDKPVPALLQEALGVPVDNHGVPGSTAAALLAGFGDNKPWPELIAASRAQVVYLNFGINDADDRGAETPETFRAALREVVRLARESGKAVVLETANPVGDAHYTRLPLFAQVTRDVAAESGARLVDQYAQLSAIDWRALMSDTMQAHPTQEGYRVKARIALETVGQAVHAIP